MVKQQFVGLFLVLAMACLADANFWSGAAAQEIQDASAAQAGSGKAHVAPKAVSSATSESVSADDALRRLVAGNARFISEKPKHPHENSKWRESLESKQHPFAVVLGCSDSRVPPELVFDQGFGDLFVIRVAGNVVDTDVTASVEYAINHLDTRLIVVMGHSGCGAVSAAIDHLADSAGEPSEVVSLLYRIEPSIAGLPKELDRDQKIAKAVSRNVELAVRRLSRVPNIQAALKINDVRIVGAVYDMHTGKVQLDAD